MIEVGGIPFTIAIGALVALFYLLYSFILKKQPDSSPQSNEEDHSETKTSNSKNNQQQASQKAGKDKKSASKQQFANKSKESNVFKHKLLASTLKAHSDVVTGIDFSSNGKYLISCGRDRALFMWSTKEFESPNHKSIRCNVEFDHATKIRFSPDSRAFIVALGISNTIRAFKLVKREDSNVHIMQAAIEDFPKMHKADLINIGLSCNGKFIMTCSQDTTINIWNVKGDLLGTVDSRAMNNSYATVSPCGRFFGVCGFTPDVKIWEVVFDKSDSFKEIRRAFELKGHSAGVYAFSFNSDSTRMASVSKDQTWKLWDSNINYEKGQDAKELLTVILPQKGASLVAISPDSLTVAVTVNNNLYFYDALTGKLDETVENFSIENPNEICFSVDNKYLAVACDRQVKVFYNMTGHRVAISDFESKLKTAKTQAAKERIEQAIEEHRKSIEDIEEKSKSAV